MKKLIIFDLDGTLAESKSALDAEMAQWLGRLMEVSQVAVISGGAWPQFQSQLLANLPKDGRLDRLFLLPTSGTRFLRHEDGDWKQLYAEDFTPEQKTKIIDALNACLDKSGLRPAQHWGDVIEDRGSQITMSALGQQAPLDQKKTWDPDFAKRKTLKAMLQPLLPEFAIGMGGASSIDVTRPGVDKAYGIQKLSEILEIPIAQMVFVGDALFEGGNDYPARRTGAACIQIDGPHETKKVIETYIVCSG
jgi:HAD superfamily hydrolase (TIGR01484 family)